MRNMPDGENVTKPNGSGEIGITRIVVSGVFVESAIFHIAPIHNNGNESTIVKLNDNE